MKNWNKQQLAIFAWFTGAARNCQNLIIRARAGTGKTTTIIEGLNQAKERNVLYAVFNKKNQLEASERISNQNVSVKTLHSVGFGIILKNWRGVRASGYTEFGRAKSLFPDSPKQIHFQVARLVSLLKNLFINPSLTDAKQTAEIRGIDGGIHADDFSIEKIAEMALQVLELSREYPKDKQISFDDMVWLPMAMGWVQPAFDLVCIDEAQDCNAPQLEMVVGLSKGAVVMVGDDKQAIYHFRGSMANSLDIFKQRLNAEELPLTVTYRCPKRVVKLAQTIVPDIQFHENSPEGIIEMINYDKAINTVKVGDVILSRTNAPLIRACLTLIRKNVPSYVEGRDVAKQLLDIVKELNANSVIHFLDKLEQWKDAKIQKATGWAAIAKIDLVQDQAATLRIIAESCIELSDIEKKINQLFQDSEYNRVPAVVCSSVHKFKGLENETVNLLSDSFKSRRSATPEEVMEENNIYYVAITRTKRVLNLVSGLVENE